MDKEIRFALQKFKQKLGIEESIESLKTHHLGYGENNESLLVTVNNHYHFTFRIAMQRSKVRMLTKEKHMEKEFKLLQNLPEGVAPKAFVFDKTKTILPRSYCILSYVNGKHKITWSRKDLIRYAKTLSKLHSKKFSHSWIDGKKTKTYNFYNHYLKNWLPDHKSVLGDNGVRELVPHVLSFIKKNNHLFLGLKKFSRIHGDLCNDNILFTKSGVVFIDWEWSSIGDPARDLARVFSTSFSFKP